MHASPSLGRVTKITVCGIVHWAVDHFLNTCLARNKRAAVSPTSEASITSVA